MCYNDSKVILPSSVLLTNLLGWWPLSEGAGLIAYDGSGNGSHGSVENEEGDEWLTGQTGCPQLVEGYNRPMLFDGSNDYVNITDGLTSGTNAVSISVWCNGISGNSYYPAWRLGNAITAGLCIHGSLNRIEGGAGASETFDKSGFGNSLVDGTWHHILVTYDGSEIRKYEDGVYISGATFSSHGTWTAADGLGSETNTTIGSFWAGYFEGMINELIVYDTTLVAADAAILAATGPNGGPLPPDPYGMSYSAGISSSNIAGYWRNDGDVTWTDRSGNGNTGTVNGSPDALLFKQGYNGSASTSTGRDNQGFPLRFKDNGAIGFNGSSDYISVANSSAVNFGAGNFTLAAWVKLADYTNGTALAIFHKQSGGTRYYMTWRGDVGNYIQVAIDGDTGSNLDIASGTMSNNNWNYVVATINRDTPEHKIYINGTQSGSTSTGNTTGSLTTTVPLIIGMSSVGTTNQWDGQIASAQIYQRALTQAEMKQNFNAQRSRFNV